jgi:hypothetical protein
VLRGIGVPRTTVGRLGLGLKEDGSSTIPGVNGTSRGLGGSGSEGPRSRNRTGVAAGCRILIDDDGGAVLLGGVRSAIESVLFLALRGDSLRAIFRRPATAARDSATRSFWRALQLVHCLVNFVGSLMLRNSTSGRFRLQVWQLRSAWGATSSIWV